MWGADRWMWGTPALPEVLEKPLLHTAAHTVWRPLPILILQDLPEVPSLMRPLRPDVCPQTPTLTLTRLEKLEMLQPAILPCGLPTHLHSLPTFVPPGLCLRCSLKPPYSFPLCLNPFFLQAKQVPHSP